MPVQQDFEHNSSRPAPVEERDERRLLGGLEQLGDALERLLFTLSAAESRADGDDEPWQSPRPAALTALAGTSGSSEHTPMQADEPPADGVMEVRVLETATPETTEQTGTAAAADTQTTPAPAAPKRPRIVAPGDADAAPAVTIGTGAGVELIASPFTSFGGLNHFITSVGGLPEVRGVTMLRFRDGVLHLLVDTDTAIALGRRLREAPTIAIDQLRENGAAIEMTISSAPA